MTPEKLDRDSLSQLYALARAAKHDGDSLTCGPNSVIALIDRVRELEGENKVMRELVHSANNPLTGTHTVAWQQKARAALERSEILNKE